MPKKSTRKPKSQLPPAAQAIQFKVTLAYIEPPIWRRLVLPDIFTLGDLHDAIQATFGWEECHMHQFWLDKGKERVCFTKAAAFEIDDAEDEDVTLLSQVISGPGQVFQYEYDFGDSWEHEILVEEFLPLDHKAHYPLCLDGARNGPPEDCGGPPGYDHVLKALRAKRKTVDQQEIIEWLGDYDPEKFDLAETNKRLRSWC